MPEQNYTPKINTVYFMHKFLTSIIVFAFFRQKIEDLEQERQSLEEKNNILEMRLERHNLQVGTNTSIQLFFVMDLLVWRKGTNLITLRVAA